MRICCHIPFATWASQRVECHYFLTVPSYNHDLCRRWHRFICSILCRLVWKVAIYKVECDTSNDIRIVVVYGYINVFLYILQVLLRHRHRNSASFVRNLHFGNNSILRESIFGGKISHILVCWVFVYFYFWLVSTQRSSLAYLIVHNLPPRYLCFMGHLSFGSIKSSLYLG